MIKISDVEIDLNDTVTCGQCFRFKKNCDDSFTMILSDRVIRIKQENNDLIVYSNNEDDLENIIINYFDLKTDYNKINKKLIKKDKVLIVPIECSKGFRILKQEPFEMLISYIISQNNNVKRIMKSVDLLSSKFGKKVDFENEEYYLFPTVSQLKAVTIDEYRKLGVGFRDRYIKDTVETILNGGFDVNNVDNLTTNELRKELMKLKGVGQKVADCIMLFSCGREEVFPVDVWVERVMSVLYFKDNKGSMKKKDIIEYADKNFRKNAGIIQQHLFYNMRENMI